MDLLKRAYEGKRVLITGHSGFKGSWLACWLRRLGAKVYGIGFTPHVGVTHYNVLMSTDPEMVVQEFDKDIRTIVRLPVEVDVVFHLAASAIVAETFKDPKHTFSNNIGCALSILEAVRLSSNQPPIVMITTDKVYANKEWDWGYRENDELGGLDPYSASKVCVEFVTECYRTQFLPYIATARAGNVIGGGDYSAHRLIPDIVRAALANRPVQIHTPAATRPWQHVLEPLYGYLLLGKHLMEGNTEAAKNWNFGPTGEMTVIEVLSVASRVWNKIRYEVDNKETHPSMVTLLKIDSTEARRHLGWKPLWSMEEAVTRAIMWYREFYEQNVIRTDLDIDAYANGKVWEGRQ